MDELRRAVREKRLLETLIVWKTAATAAAKILRLITTRKLLKYSDRAILQHTLTHTHSIVRRHAIVPIYPVTGIFGSGRSVNEY